MNSLENAPAPKRNIQSKQDDESPSHEEMEPNLKESKGTGFKKV
jgi:hypothetical protein